MGNTMLILLASNLMAVSTLSFYPFLFNFLGCILQLPRSSMSVHLTAKNITLLLKMKFSINNIYLKMCSSDAFHLYSPFSLSFAGIDHWIFASLVKIAMFG